VKNINQILRELEKEGCEIVHSKGSKAKIYHPNGPFFSIHIGEKTIHPLKRFAKKHWGINLEEL